MNQHMKNPTKNAKHPEVKESGHIACQDCALDDVCKPISFGDQSFDQTHSILERRTPILAGEYLYKKGDPLNSIYALTSGTVKLVKTTSKGLQQVVGFRFPGELLGDEAISTEIHILSAVAIDNATTCDMSMKGLDDIAQMIPSFQNNLIKLLSNQCYTMHLQFTSYAGRNNAEERLAAFILNVAERNSNKDILKLNIFLAMTRDDIANFLGLRRETLSRTFTKLQKTKIITIENKELDIIDIEKLRLLANY